MKQSSILLIIFLLTGLTLSHAEIPLTLEATIQLPASGGWDVQHWMTDSTFGWACIAGTTICYVRQLGDSMQQFPAPQQAWDPNAYPDILTPYPITPRELRLLRMDTDSNRAYVLLESRGYLVVMPDNEYCVFSLFDLTTRQAMDTFWTPGNQTYSMGGAYHQTVVTIQDLSVWPPPPTFSSVLSFTSIQTTNGESPGGYSWGDHFGGLVYADVNSLPSRALVSVTPADRAVPFVPASPSRLALFGRSAHAFQNEEGQGTATDTCWVNTYRSVPGASPRHYLTTDICATARIAAQQDADGTSRIIARDDNRVWAVDATTYAPLWQSNTIAGDIYTAELAGSGDERLLSFDSTAHRFRVYDAASGAFLDETAPVLGTLDHLIKRPDHLAEIVTREGNTVRVYTSGLALPAALTCYYLPESNLLRLRWRAVAMAQGYGIYAAESADGDYVQIAQVATGVLSYDLPPQDTQRFFRVTAEYPSR
ncbi:MAG TPA: hypothetical protein VGL38_13110 [bacterium]|jgi:hypothetical protein